VEGELTLNTLKPNEGAHKKKRILGRGLGSSKGKTCGRGTKGNGARSGGTLNPGFEGGQTPLYKVVRKFEGFSNRRFRIEREQINLDRIQYFIDTGRLNPDQIITMRTLKDSGVVSRLNSPLKVLGNGGDWFKAKIHLQVSAISASARAAIEKNGGKVESVFFNKLGLKEFLHTPLDKITINFARAPVSEAHLYDIPRYELPDSIKPPKVVYAGPIDLVQFAAKSRRAFLDSLAKHERLASAPVVETQTASI